MSGHTTFIKKLFDEKETYRRESEKLQSQLEAANKVIDIYGFALGVIEGGDDNGDCDTALEAIEQVEKIRNGGEV